MEPPQLPRLTCSVKSYDWGRKGSAGPLVAKLAALNSGAQIDPELPYAEFWMGTHDSGPSFTGPHSLSSLISRDPGVLGDRVQQRWGCDLPFLFKVLSVAKALSIQAHPDKKLAEALHSARPDLYKDDNHKPEMALAVTEFEALCGFVPVEELKNVLQSVPEVVELIQTADVEMFLSLNEDDNEKAKAILQSIFTQLNSASKERVAEAVTKLVARLESQSQVRKLSDKEQLVLRLEKQYPADVGVISAFFLNYLKLNPGEALYLGANEPHAYLFGECIECMATSDNVVRAGLTPKHRDVETLCSMLTYKQGLPEILHGAPLNSYIKKYVTPFDEFEVDACSLPEKMSTSFPSVGGPSIFLVTAGKGKMSAGSGSAVEGDPVTEGDVIFVPANTEISFTSETGLQAYRAGVSGRFLEAK